MTKNNGLLVFHMVMQKPNLAVFSLMAHVSKSYKLIPFPVQNIIYIKNTGTTSEEYQITSLQSSQSLPSSVQSVTFPS